MPSTQFATLMAAQIDGRGPEIMNQVEGGHPLLTKIKKEGGFDTWDGGGDNIEFNVKTGMSDRVAARDYKTALEFKEQNPIETLSIPRRFVNGSVIWYEAQVEANKGKGKVFDLVNTLIDDVKESATDAFGLELWQGGTGEHLHGIPAIMTAATYAGKARSTTVNNWWMAKQGSAFTVTLPNGNTVTYGPYGTVEPLVLHGGTDGGVIKLYNDCCLNGGTGGPTFGVTSETLWLKLWDLIGADKVRQNDAMADAGFPENIQFRRATIFWDRNCGATAGTPDATTFAFLNTEFLKVRPYSEYANGFKATETFNKHSDGLFAEGKLIQWAGNILCKKPQRCGQLTGKTA